MGWASPAGSRRAPSWESNARQAQARVRVALSEIEQGDNASHACEGNSGIGIPESCRHKSAASHPLKERTERDAVATVHSVNDTAGFVWVQTRAGNDNLAVAVPAEDRRSLRTFEQRVVGHALPPDWHLRERDEHGT